MTHCCPRPPMQWSGAIGVIARCKRASTVCAPKSRSRRALRSICGEKPKAKGVTRPCKAYIGRVQDESSPVSSLQSPMRQFETAVDWGRYAELFEYEASERRLSIP